MPLHCCYNSVQDGLKAGGYIDAGAPSSLPPKQNILTPLMSAVNGKHEMLSLKKEMREKKQDFQMTESANPGLKKKAIAIYNAGKEMKWKVFSMKPCCYCKAT
ncbi:hypothetical protein A2U01_0032964 [Trifolium medium]|uniref:Uncharacterized protein n=1 Tax=Trifolium medium TaxID=97028 RepID=A0A392PJA2_9FABA|nr:hypothetical protein [Trifolium medium]